MFSFSPRRSITTRRSVCRLAIVTAIFALTFTLAAQAQTYRVIHYFSGADGYYPRDLTIDQAGNLYGAAGAGGSHNVGVIYRMTQHGSAWTFVPLYNFNGGDDGDGRGELSLGPVESCMAPQCPAVLDIMARSLASRHLHHSATQFCVRGPRHNCTSSLASQMMARFLGTPTSFSTSRATSMERQPLAGRDRAQDRPGAVRCTSFRRITATGVRRSFIHSKVARMVTILWVAWCSIRPVTCSAPRTQVEITMEERFTNSPQVMALGQRTQSSPLTGSTARSPMHRCSSTPAETYTVQPRTTVNTITAMHSN